MSIAFEGQLLQQPKHVDSPGQHRSMSSAQAIAAVRPHLRRCGVTRIADITGLDRLGVPVTLAVRPNSLTLSTSSGKGLTREAAAISAMMESLELHVAETADLPFEEASFERLARECVVVDVARLPRRKGCAFRADWPELWGSSRDLVSGAETKVPYCMLVLRHVASSSGMPGLAGFPVDSNGLASGMTPAEALVSAVYEVIERDAVTCHTYAYDNGNVPLRRLPPEAIPYEAVRDLMRQIDDGGAKALLYDCTVDTCIPVFKALIYDRHDTRMPPGGGYGAHLDIEVAMIRALTEAAQGRAVVIAGARDDVFAFDVRRGRARSTPVPEPLSVDVTPDAAPAFEAGRATAAFEEDLAVIVDRLRCAGFGQILVARLPSDLPITVVKAIVPGLEGYRGHSYAPGARALRYAGAMRSREEEAPLRQPLYTHLPAGGAR